MGVNGAYHSTYRSEFGKVSVSSFVNHISFRSHYPCLDNALCDFAMEAHVFSAIALWMPMCALQGPTCAVGTCFSTSVFVRYRENTLRV